MAYETAVANDYLDLMDKVATFAALQGWTVKRNTATAASDQQLVLENPTADTYVGIVAIEGIDTSNSDRNPYFNWKLQAFETYDDLLHVHEQVGAIPQRGYLGVTNYAEESPMLTLADQPMRYWLFVSDNRITVTVRVFGYYVNAYVGKMDALAPTTEYASPLLVGGNMASHTTVSYRPWSIKTLLNFYTTSISSIPDFNSNWMFGIGFYCGGPRVKLPDGTWSTIKNNDRFYNYKQPSTITNYCKSWPFNAGLFDLSLNFDGSYPIFRNLITSELTNGEGQWLGYAEGIVATASEGAASESIITDQNAEEYIVFNNVFRNNSGQHFAIKLV